MSRTSHMGRRMPLGIQSRILLVLLPMVGLVVAGVIWYLMQTRDAVRRSLLFLQLPEITGAFVQSGDPADLPGRFMGSELVYTLYDGEGRLLWVRPEGERPRRLRWSTIEQEQRVAWHRRDVGRTINAPVRLADGRVLMVSKTDTAERAAIEAVLNARVRHSLLVLLPLSLLFGLLLLAMLRWALRPVRAAAQTARRIGPYSPQRIPLRDLPAEVQPLARAANEAMDRLSDALGRERKVLADGAHELRTPLTVLDLRLQRMRDGVDTDWQAIDAAMQGMRRLVDQLLSLARQEQPFDASASSGCQLVHVAQNSVAMLHPLFEAAGREIALDADDALPRVRGDSHWLQEAVVCVIENALRHGRGSVQVRLSAGTAADQVWLEVEDEGDGVELDGQERFFARFHKGRQGTAGSGLGLAIARRVMENHGGSIAFVQRRPCVVRLRFSCAAPPPGSSEDS